MSFCIKTYTGKMLHFDNPQLDQIDIMDIAQGLSMTCRFSGQCMRFYSVAEHCVHISYRVPEDLALHALLHDAGEAYVGDMTSPLKKLLRMVGQLEYSDTENRIMAVIAEKYGFNKKKHDVIHHADLKMFATEATQLMKNGLEYPGVDMSGIPEPYVGLDIAGWPPAIAKDRFLNRFFTLSASVPDMDRIPPEGDSA